MSKQDLLIQIHDRSIRLRKLSLQSIELAVAGSLLKLSGDGDAIPLPRTKARGLSDEVKHLMDLADKLGAWFGELTVHEIVTTLKVRL